jgi:excisionase family DNA binding protein
VLPEAIYRLLCDIVPLLKRGDSVFLMQGNRALTTQEAAELLGMSRTYLTKLVDSGAIPSFRVGSHRRIRFKDIVDYQERRDAERQESMDAILAQSDELDLYG